MTPGDVKPSTVMVLVNKKRFRVMLTHEDGAWIAECTSIPGCSVTGKTIREAIQSMREVLILWERTLEWTADYICKL